jgi:hypothetical protein
MKTGTGGTRGKQVLSEYHISVEYIPGRTQAHCCVWLPRSAEPAPVLQLRGCNTLVEDIFIFMVADAHALDNGIQFHSVRNSFFSAISKNS